MPDLPLLHGRPNARSASAKDDAGGEHAPHALSRREARSLPGGISALDLFPDAVLLVDRASRIRLANTAAAALFRQPAAKIAGCMLWDVLPWTASVLMRRELRYATEERAEVEFTERDEVNARGYEVRARCLPDGLLLVLRDVTRRMAERERQHQAADATERTLAEAELLNEVFSIAAGEHRLETIFTSVLRRLARLIHYENGRIALVEADELVVVAAHGPAAEAALGRPLPRERSWTVLQSGEPYLGTATHNAGRGDGYLLAAPLLWRGAHVGLLELDVPAPEALPPNASHLLRLVAAALSASAKLAFRYQSEVNARLDLEAVARERDALLRQKDEVLAVVSHDLRNPLSVIHTAAALTWSELSAEQRGNDEGEQLQMILRQTRRMERLIQDLLDVALIDTGGFFLAPATCDTASLMVASRDELSSLAAAKGVRWEVVHSALPSILADRSRVVQVLSNLIGNAVKFTEPGGSVTVSAQEEAAAVRFAVADTGVGIAAEHLPHLFDRGWQVRRSGRAGAGLGLAIAQAIVREHGSTLQVQSEPGQGTTFWFSLPVAR